MSGIQRRHEHLQITHNGMPYWSGEAIKDLIEELHDTLDYDSVDIEAGMCTCYTDELDSRRDKFEETCLEFLQKVKNND